MSYCPKRWRCPSCGSLSVKKIHLFETGYKCASCGAVLENRLDMDTDAGKIAYDKLVDRGIRVRAVSVG